jgi:uncharacterized protein YjbI with pentapeptide repeats
MMKKFFLIVTLIIGISGMAFADAVIYTFFVNIAPGDSDIPLIGLINIASGNHNTLHLGLVSVNAGDFSGAQASLVSVAGGSFSGAQLGLAAIAGGNFRGAQMGLANAVIGGFNGLQWGFGNFTGGDFEGLQLGLANFTVKKFSGAQIGLGNFTGGDFDGLQLGLVNVTPKKISGAQIGLVNFADSIDGSLQFGLINMARNGGYRAFEYSFSDFFPIAIALKTGVERLYTSLFIAYSGQLPVGKNLAAGIGLGAILPVSAALFLNPELNLLNTNWARASQTFLSLIPHLGINLGKDWSVTLGPSVTWAHNSSSEPMQEPVFGIISHDLNSNNRIVLGARIGIRVRL